MRYLFCLTLVAFLSLGGCVSESYSTSFDSATIEPTVTHSYSEISDKKIAWNDVFFPQKEHYFVYLYSLTCNHCNQLKNAIIEYGLSHDDIYFVQDSEDVIINKNTDQTIGITDVKNLCIKGFPSLLEIHDKTLVKNVAGITDINSSLNL